MSARPVSAARPLPGARPASWPFLAALVLTIAALAITGAVIGAGVLSRGDSPAGVPADSLPKGPFGVGQDIPATFGAVAVENVAKIKGLTAKDVSGVTHGIPNLVKAGQMQVQASVTMTNLTDQPIRYSPTQFRLLVGKDRKPVHEVRSNIRPGTLQPDAAVDGRLSFVAPASGQKLWLAFDDPGRDRPILIDLGRTGRQTPDSAFERFHHR